MKRILWLGLALALFAPLGTRAEPASVCVIAIREDITHNTLYLVRRGLKEAATTGARAVVLDMDTNGGRVDVTEEIIKALQHSPVPVYTFVNAKAFSAGAFIAAATTNIYMTPGSVIGAATPVVLSSGGEGVMALPKSYEEKISSAMRALIRATAEQKGHNPDVFEAMVDSDKELVLDGKTLNPKGKLLTLTDTEAARTYGKPPVPLLSAGTVKSLPELLAKINLAGAAVVEVKPYGFEIAARWITTLSPILILIGMAAIYFEFKLGGIGLPLLVAVGAFSLYFFGFFAAGLAGWEDVVVFAVGLLLICIELFVLPGHALPGVLGAGLILVSLVMAMVQRWPGGPVIPAWPELHVPILTVASAFVGSVVVMLVAGRFLPESPFFRRMELTAATNAADGYTTATSAAAHLLGATGVAESLLRPSGKGRFDSQIVDVVTEGEFIEKGEAIKVAAVQGSRVLVTRVG